mgnify:CR=1 FL=1
MTQQTNCEVEPHILEFTGFDECDFGSDLVGPCDKCRATHQQLYFGNVNYWDCREGDYWCANCVRKLFDANSEFEQSDYFMEETEAIGDGSSWLRKLSVLGKECC